MNEWKVLRQGVLWSDKFKSVEDCIAHINECVERDGTGVYSDYTWEQMTDDDLKEYR